MEQRSALTVNELLPVDQEAVADGAARGSRTKAEDYVVRLQSRVDATSTTTTSTTTTTLPTTTTLAPAAPVTPVP